jgi:hypothetical protein
LRLKPFLFWTCLFGLKAIFSLALVLVWDLVTILSPSKMTILPLGKKWIRCRVQFTDGFLGVSRGALYLKFLLYGELYGLQGFWSQREKEDYNYSRLSLLKYRRTLTFCLALIQTYSSSFLKSSFQVFKVKLALSKITLFPVVQMIKHVVMTTT